MGKDNRQDNSTAVRIYEAIQEFQDEIGKIDTQAGMEALAAYFSALFELKFKLEALGKEEGFEDDELLKFPELDELFRRRLGSEMSVGEYRTRILSAAYRLDLDVPGSGEKDSRMDRALRNAVWYEHRILYRENIIPSENLEGRELLEAEAKLDTAIETFRKSVYRYRQEVRGRTILRRKPGSPIVEALDAEEFLFRDLPKKPGPPPKRS